MAMVINSNIMSLNAQRNLTSAQNEQNTAMERLTSGKRINSAADDAAGLSIASRMTSQISGLNQAVRNANDGQSLIQTAEGALDESTNILQRMRELSIQSANGTYDSGNRSTMNAEVKQLVAELDRISETTSFNGQNVLDGSLGKVSLQVGSEANQTISMEIGAMDSKSLGLGSTSSDLAGTAIATTGTIEDGDVLINDQKVGAHDFANDPLNDLITDINDNVDGVNASGYNIMESTGIADGVIAAGDTFTITVGSTDGSADTVYTIGGTGISTNSTSDMVDLINEKAGSAVTAALTDEGNLTLSNASGGTITVDAGTMTAGELLSATGFADAATQAGSIALSSDDGEAVTVTKGANGTDADLAAIGFNSVEGQGEVLGGSLSATNQTTALAAGDLSINGVTIDSSNTDSLQGKVDNINAVSDATGVTASIEAEESYSFDLTNSLANVEATSVIGTTTASDLVVNGVTVTFAGGETAAEAATLINAETGDTGVTASVNDLGYMSLTSDSAFTLSGANAAQLGTGISATTFTASDGGGLTGAADLGSLTINGYEIENLDLDSIDNAVTEINAASGNTGVRAEIDTNGELKFTGTSQITIQQGNENGQATAKLLGLEFTADSLGSDGLNDTLTISPRIKLESSGGQAISVDVTANGATRTGLKDMNTDLSSTVTGSAISSIDISTAAGAQKAIESIDNALTTINDARGEMGAVANRLDFTVSNLSNVAESVSEARSRIEDADFAQESANLSRAQVLQQAGTAMLAQANAAPQQVLSLLQ